MDYKSMLCFIREVQLEREPADATQTKAVERFQQALDEKRTNLLSGLDRDLRISESLKEMHRFFAEEEEGELRVLSLDLMEDEFPLLKSSMAKLEKLRLEEAALREDVAKVEDVFNYCEHTVKRRRLMSFAQDEIELQRERATRLHAAKLARLTKERSVMSCQIINNTENFEQWQYSPNLNKAYEEMVSFVADLRDVFDTMTTLPFELFGSV
jgi:hypothetical protein